MHGTLRFLLYGIFVKIFIMNRYISKSYTTTKNAIGRSTELGLFGQHIYVRCCDSTVYCRFKVYKGLYGISPREMFPAARSVTSLLCGSFADLWPFYGFLCLPLYREKTFYIKTHKTAINRPVYHTGET